MDWTIEYYRDADGYEPAKHFVSSLSNSARAKALRTLALLKEHGVLLKEPYTRQLKGKIRELRVKDNQGNVRVLYFTHTGKRFILLHGFVKKTDKTPVREIETAEKRMNDFLERQEEVKK
jgi:phage-related protein